MFTDSHTDARDPIAALPAHRTPADPLPVIREAARARRAVVIDAYDERGARERRRIEPYSVRVYADGARLFFFCLKRGGIRSVLLPDIVAARVTRCSFEPRRPIEL